MATITKSVSSRKGSDGTVEVYFRFSAGRGAVYRIKTGIRVPADKWNPATSTVIVPRLATIEQRELSEIRKKIESLERHLSEQYYQARAGGVEISRSWFENAVKLFHNPAYIPNSNLDADALMQIFLEEKRVKGEDTKNYAAFGRTLARYEDERGRRINPREWTTDDLTMFEGFLSSERGTPALSQKSNTFVARLSRKVSNAL